MADKEAQIPGSFPEPQVGTKFALTVSITEFMIAVGHTRLGYSGGGSAVSSMVEYHTAHSVSPSAAKQLAMLLALSIRQYEARFGAIPEDPEVTQKLLTAGQSATIKGGKLVRSKAAPTKKAVAKKR